MTIAMAGLASAKAWRGVTPLHSTLTNVVRQFGTCNSTTKSSCTYNWKTETVVFIFLPGPCGVGEKTLPRHTVVRIERRPMIVTRLPDYTQIDFSHYSAFRFPDDSGTSFENYVDDIEGFAAEAEKSVVTEVHYTATAQESSLCPDSYVKPSELLPRREPRIVTEFFCPLLVVTCPNMTVEVDEPITLSASLAGGVPYMKPIYTWSISAGRIARGQGTPSIRVNTKGLVDDTEVTATVTVGGIPVNCKRQASCTSKIHPYRVRKKG